MSHPELLLIPVRDSTFIYSAPDFSLDTIVHVDLRIPQGIPGTTRVMGLDVRRGTRTDDWSKLNVFDYAAMKLVDSIIIDEDSAGFGIPLYRFHISPDGRLLYALGGRHPPASLICYDMIDHETVFIRALPRQYGLGDVRVTPDGKEVWVTDPGTPLGDFPDWADKIFIFDALTGAEIGSVSLTGLRPDSSSVPLAANEIQFLPTGEKAYVNCGGRLNAHGHEPILVIDVRTRQVLKKIYDDFKNMSRDLAIAPRP